MGIGSFLKSVAGPLIGAGSSLLGGLMGSNSNKENYEAQREFAQYGIRWKVADAKAAGIHPLYALGANTVSFQPSYVGDPMGEAMGSMGQNLSRAFDAKKTIPERRGQQAVQHLQQLQMEEDLKSKRLNNKLLELEINKSQQTPPMPTVGGIKPANMLGIIGQDSGVDSALNNITGTSGLPLINPLMDSQGRLSGPVEFAPSKIEVSGKPGFTYGVPPMETFSRDNNGFYWRLPSKDVKESIEDIMVPETQYNLKRAAELIMGWFPRTSFGVKMQEINKPPDNMKRDDEVYVWYPAYGAWRAVKKKGRR